jgi:hypothetical protein
MPVVRDGQSRHGFELLELREAPAGVGVPSLGSSAAGGTQRTAQRCY